MKSPAEVRHERLLNGEPADARPMPRKFQRVEQRAESKKRSENRAAKVWHFVQ